MVRQQSGDLTFYNFKSYLTQNFKVHFRNNKFNIYQENFDKLLVIFTSLEDFKIFTKRNKIYKSNGFPLIDEYFEGLLDSIRYQYFDEKIPVAFEFEKRKNKEYFVFYGWCYVNWYLNDTVAKEDIDWEIFIISNQKKSYKFKKLKI